MGQWFQMVNIDKRETCGPRGNWGECDSAGWLCGWICAVKLKVPTLEEIFGATDLFRCNDIDRAATLGSFNKIPVELIDTIFKALPTMESAIIFAITNSRLFAIGYPTISQRIADAGLAPWVYDKIIYIGSDAEDLPNDCLTEDNELSLLKDIPTHKANGHPYRDRDGNLDFYSIASDSFTDLEEDTPLDDDPCPRMDIADLRRYRYLDDPTWESLRKRIESPVSINTTKKEYVRETDGIEVAVIILQLIVWGRPQYEWDLHGPWAGDRLAIVEMDDLAARMEREDGWRDFTEEGLDYQDTFLKIFDY